LRLKAAKLLATRPGRRSSSTKLPGSEPSQGLQWFESKPRLLKVVAVNIVVANGRVFAVEAEDFADQAKPSWLLLQSGHPTIIDDLFLELIYFAQFTSLRRMKCKNFNMFDAINRECLAIIQLQ
jgi:hypothetical protein